MSNTPKLPVGHPLMKRVPIGVSPFELAGSIVAARRGWSGPLGMTMKDPDPDPDPDDDDETEDTDPDTEIVVDGKPLKVGKLKTIFAREKKQGKRAGTAEALKALGFDTLDEAKAFVEKFQEDGDKPPADDKTTDDEATKEARRKAADAERAARKREETAAAKERRADLRGALRSEGVAKEDLDDALALLDREVDAEYDDDDLEEAVEALRERRPGLFGDDEETSTSKKEKPAPKATIPKGGPKRRNQPQEVFGAGGLERARRKGWVKDSASA